MCVCAIWIAIFHMNDNTLFIGLPSCEGIFHYTKKSVKTLCYHSFINLFPCQSRLQEEMGCLSALFCRCEVGVVTVQL